MSEEGLTKMSWESGCVRWDAVTARSKKSLSILGDILQASDNLSRVINSYKTVVEGQVINGEVVTSAIPDSEGKVFWFPTPDPSGPAPVPTTRPRCRLTSVSSHRARGASQPLQAVPLGGLYRVSPACLLRWLFSLHLAQVLWD